MTTTSPVPATSSSTLHQLASHACRRHPDGSDPAGELLSHADALLPRGIPLARDLLCQARRREARGTVTPGRWHHSQATSARNRPAHAVRNDSVELLTTAGREALPAMPREGALEAAWNRTGRQVDLLTVSMEALEAVGARAPLFPVSVVGGALFLVDSIKEIAKANHEGKALAAQAATAQGFAAVVAPVLAWGSLPRDVEVRLKRQERRLPAGLRPHFRRGAATGARAATHLDPRSRAHAVAELRRLTPTVVQAGDDERDLSRRLQVLILGLHGDANLRL